MEKYNSQKDDKLTKVKDEITVVKDVMIKNIDKVLERGERIELLVDKAEELDQHAVKFNRQSRNLKRSLWWKNIRLMILITVIIILVILAILAVVGFLLFKRSQANKLSGNLAYTRA